MSEDFLEQAGAGAVRYKLRRRGLDHRFAAAEGALDGAEPAAHVGEDLLPGLRRNEVFAVGIFPDVGVDALGVTDPRQQDDDGGRTAMIGGAAACDGAQSIVDAIVNAFIAPSERSRHYPMITEYARGGNNPYLG